MPLLITKYILNGVRDVDSNNVILLDMGIDDVQLLSFSESLIMIIYIDIQLYTQSKILIFYIFIWIYLIY